jgi:hypothetical protein
MLSEERVSSLLIVLSIFGCGDDLMGVPGATRVTTDCTGGINQIDEKIAPNECSDALNVWAPQGTVERRPGYTGVSADVECIPTGGFVFDIIKSVNGVLGNTNDLSLLVKDRDYWYLMLGPEGALDIANIYSFAFSMALANGNATRAIAEYYNGSAWVLLPVLEWGYHLSGVGAGFTITAPRDWALQTILGVTAYPIRFSITDADTDATTLVNPNMTFYLGTLLTNHKQQILTAVRNGSAVKYVRGSTSTNIVGSYWTFNVTVTADIAQKLYLDLGAFELTSPSLLPGTQAYVPGAQELYVAANNNNVVVSSVLTVVGAAVVENRDFAIGTGAPYDKTTIALRAEWPRANLIHYAGKRLWAADILDDQAAIYWSAPEPYQRVWPLLSREPLTGEAKITALADLDEQVVVYTDKSIWLMVPRGVDAFGVAEFTPVRRVDGVGCISHATVQSVRGAHVFLSRDGLYAFNGAEVKKLSQQDDYDKLRPFFQRVNWAAAKSAVAVVWPEKSVYLIALPVDGSNINNIVLVYDYESHAFWIWDDIHAQAWLYDNGAIYFADQYGRVYELGKGDTDHGALIISYVITAPVGLKVESQKQVGRPRKRLAQVDTTAIQTARALKVSVIADDGEETTPVTFDLTNPNLEKEWGTLIWNTDSWTKERRRQDFSAHNLDGSWFKIRVQHDIKGVPFKLNEVGITIRLVE